MHVNPEEAVMIHKDIQCKRSLGIHWGTFKLTHEPFLEPPQKLKKLADENRGDSTTVNKEDTTCGEPNSTKNNGTKRELPSTTTTTTEDSDSSAKSGIENDCEEFKRQGDGDELREGGSAIVEDDLLDKEDTDDYLLYLEDTLKSIHEAFVVYTLFS